MHRREFLRLAGGAAIVSTAGCSGGGSDEGQDATVEDSDGDGVIDSKDYAPHDPAVQEKADLVTATTRTTTSRPTTTTEISTSTTSTKRTTTASTDLVSSDVTGKIDADIDEVRGFVPSYFEWYSMTEAELAFRNDAIDFPSEQMDVVVAAAEYPRASTLDFDRADSVPTTGTGVTRFRTTFDLDVPEDTPFSLLAMLVSSDVKFEELTSADTVTLAETDRLVIKNGHLQKSEHPDAKNTLTTNAYERLVGEGIYAIQVNGNSNSIFSDAVDFGLFVFKSVYIKETNLDFDPLMTTIQNSVREGIAGELAQIMYDSATDAGYDKAVEKVNYAIRATQQLPYVSDVGTGYDAYNKYPVETLVEAGGDCEDTVILLGSVLATKPFSYGMVLLELPADNPDHVALGIKGEEGLPGYYYTYQGNPYYFIETTGEGWQIGEIPEEYKNTRASIRPIRL